MYTLYFTHIVNGEETYSDKRQFVFKNQMDKFINDNFGKIVVEDIIHDTKPRGY
jgi:hypothetical protein